MQRFLMVTSFSLCLAVPVYAMPAHVLGSFEVAQTATPSGGPAGGPNQQQYVPEGATGGRSGGPNQKQAVPEGATGGRSGGPEQKQYKEPAKTK